MKLNIGYFYKDQLNLYGDNGNVEILQYRAEKRGIPVDVKQIGINTTSDQMAVLNINMIFMGGGPDSGQKEMYEDLISSKKNFLMDYINRGGVGLFICGSYQLLGKYYQTADGSLLEGLGIFDFYTKHFGNHKPRCIGNAVCEISPRILSDPLFLKINGLGGNLVGFENHGGRTYLNKDNKYAPLAKVLSGYGNNGEDGTEGVLFKNCLGSYLHGPILSKNPHLADYLIAKALKLEDLPPLDDTLITLAHTACIKLKK